MINEREKIVFNKVFLSY